MQKLVSSYKDTMKCDGYKSKMDRYRKKQYNTIVFGVERSLYLLNRKRFRDFLHQNFELTGDIILDRIYNYFNTGSRHRRHHHHPECKMSNPLQGPKSSIYVDFTPRKVRRSRYFQRFKPTKLNLRGFL